MNTADLLIVASNRTVAAFHKTDGRQLWETVLAPGLFRLGEPFVTLIFDGSGLYAHTKSELFRLDPLTGRILWQKEASSLGRSVGSMAVLGGTSEPASAFAHIDAQRRKSD
ncbi:MAG TPA: PQQ-binding-like beta-propeller repeat protein [Candidatus Methylacidiphilales bacterium]